MARILIVEEALKNRSGHWYEYNRAIVEEARNQGHEVTLLAHTAIESDIRDELDAEPFFPVTSWDQVYYHPKAWRRYIGILRHNLSIAKLLQRHFNKLHEPYDIVLVPTVVLYHWLAWRWLVWQGTGNWFRRVILTTRNNAGEYNHESGSYVFNSSAKVLAAILRTYRGPVKRGSVELASDSSILCQQYEELCGLPFRAYPHPRPTRHLPIPANLTRESFVFSALGPPRYEKGSDLIVEAVETILNENPDFPGKFVIQWTEPVFSPDGVETVIPKSLKAHPKVELIRDSLSSEDYQRRIDESDVILVPYRRVQYHARLSGIVIEAFQSGIPCICTSNTWLSDCMDKIGKGISLTEESKDALIEGIKQLAKLLQTRGKMREREILNARQAHCPEAFIDQLLSNPG
ncbi:MAG: glycosyltransferase [Verrucomicrobiales bacterium]